MLATSTAIFANVLSDQMCRICPFLLPRFTLCGEHVILFIFSSIFFRVFSVFVGDYAKLAEHVRMSVGCHAVVGWLVSWLVRLRCKKLLLGIKGSQSAIDIFLRLEGMPLGDWAARVGQHVGPVLQRCA